MLRLIIISVLVLPLQLFGQAGKDGAKTISTAGVIFNRYSALAASAGAGSISITVANIANLDASAIAGAANNPYTTAGLAYGDLVMIIKMQGATIDATNTISYGAVTASNNAGVYELKLVRSVSGNQITFCSGLSYAYTIGGTQRVQVVRIPRLSSLTINSGASLTASAWSGSYTGGIVAIEVNGNAAINGTLTVNGLGFRGGVVDNNADLPGNTNYVSSLSANGGEKGESIAGYQADYDGLNGRYDRGAPANGGGGGDAHNSGGGGGANGSNGNSWTGQGVMKVNASNPLSAWALDPGYTANSNALTNSSGGGRGGYSYGANNLDATTTAPGNTGWGGDNRREVGGLGGRPLTYASNLLYLGGGGGAGDANNSAAQNGANGGGIIYLLVTGNLSGTGTISANGATAGATIGGNNDAPGGGGAGGAIDLNIQGTITGVTITANGGAGGNQLISGNESEGPGGGGGGGYIRTTNTPTLSVTGGASGTTTSSAVTEFTDNGATAGAAGGTLTGQAFVAAPLLDCFPLPVTLLSFNATLTPGKQAQVNWVTDNETALQNYTIESSVDALHWQMVTIVAARNATGVQHYTFTTGTLTQTTYFRLKILNTDQSYSYSDIKQLVMIAKTKIIIAGNTLLLSGIRPGAQMLRIFSTSGALISEKRLAGETSLTISGEAFAAGVYYLRLTYNSGTEEVLKFVSQ